MRKLKKADIDLKSNKSLTAANIILYASVFVGSLFNAIDPDLGWELRYGEYFLEYHQILKTNILSTTMPDYYWINHSWGADAVLYAVFHQFGFFGLSVAGALLITLIFYFFAKAAGLSVIQKIILFPILMVLEYPLNNGALRTQLMSLFLLSVLVYLISEYERGKTRMIYLTVPLLLLWASIHGEFILGLAVFSLWIVLYSVRLILTREPDSKKRITVLGVVLGLAALAVLINPFGVSIYVETFTHFLNPNLHYIIEWQPLPLFSVDWWELVSVGALFCLSAWVLISKGLFRESLPWLGLTAIIFVLSLTSRRYVWPFYYLAMPFLAVLISKLPLERIKHTGAVALGAACVVILAVIMIKSPFNSYSEWSWNSYCKVRLCSSVAADYLISHHLNTDPNLLTQYDLGGWLIWNYYPQIKPTIDGRMTLWIADNGYNPLQDFTYYEYNVQDIDKSKYDVVFTSIDKPYINRFAQLVNQGKWKIAYMDRRVAILERVKNG